MNESENIYETLNHIQSFPGVKAAGRCYSVPSDYFSDISLRLQHPDKEEAAVFPLLIRLSGKRTPYQVPSGYFEAQLPMQGLSAATPYKVPGNYWELLAGRIQKRLDKKELFQLGKIYRSTWKMAVGAAVAAVIIWSGMRWAATQKPKEGPAEIAAGRDINNMSNEQLAAFLVDRDTGTGLSGNRAGIRRSHKAAVSPDIFKSVSDKELNDFLTETTGGEDYLLN